ncbi:MAG TPA: hypothetical protein VLC53_07155, partial [Myxococcota bacterium]|nr:hypothetical protein [Myxococcota bacterium]
MSDARTALTRLLQQLAGALRAAGLYPPGHPAVHTPLRELATGLALVLRQREKVTLGLLDAVLVLDEMPFYDALAKFRAVCDALAGGGIEAVT